MPHSLFQDLGGLYFFLLFGQFLSTNISSVSGCLVVHFLRLTWSHTQPWLCWVRGGWAPAWTARGMDRHGPPKVEVLGAGHCFFEDSFWPPRLVRTSLEGARFQFQHELGFLGQGMR